MKTTNAAGWNANIDISKTYKLKPLPLDTPLTLIIELINHMRLLLHPFNNPDIERFIKDHPELVEELTS